MILSKQIGITLRDGTVEEIHAWVVELIASGEATSDELYIEDYLHCPDHHAVFALLKWPGLEVLQPYARHKPLPPPKRP